MYRLIGILALLLSALTATATEDNAADEISADSLDMILNNDSISTDSLAQDRPEEEEQEVVYTPRTSHIRVPISINIPTLEKQVNDNFKGLLYEDTVMAGDGLALKAWKASDFNFRMEGDTLFYKVPIKIWAKKEFNLGLMTTEKELEAEIVADFATAITLLPEWKLRSATQIESYEWKKKPTIKVLGQDMTLGFIADILIKKNKTMITQQLDEAISENLPLPEYMKGLWDDLQKPIPVETSGYKAWIRTQPETVACTPIRGAYGKITTAIEVATKLDVFVGSEPKQKSSNALPRLRIDDTMSDSMDIQILADLPYTLMDSVAGSFLIGQSFGEGKKAIKVDTISFYAGGEKLVIALKVSGFINGQLYLEGIPYFDNAESEIRIRDVDYSVKSKNVLVKIVNLFYKRGLKRKIENEMRISLKEEFFLLKDLGSSAMFDSDVVPGVKVNGRIDNLDVSDIFITKNGLKIALEVGGRLHVSME